MIRSTLGRIMRKAGHIGFQPYIKSFSIDDVNFRFFIGTKQAKEWYDPISKNALVEYKWLIRNIPLSNQKIIDGGAHHGQYSTVLGVAACNSQIISVDPISINLALTEVNLRLNGLSPHLVNCVIAEKEGFVNFEDVSNGRIVAHGGMQKVSKKLSTIMKDATIVKLDIEGAEFSVLPSQIDEMTSVHTWIIEIHTRNNNPEKLMELFHNRGYKLDWVNREVSVVEPYKLGTEFKCHHTTVFARRMQDR